MPGTERPKVKELDNAIRAYLDARDSRMELTKKEVEKRTILLDRMHSNGLTSYHWNGYDCTIDSKEKVKVRTSEEDDGGSDPDDED